jgi:hypothetical protein
MNVVDGRWKQHAKISRRLADVDREARQQRLEQPRLPRTQRMADAPAEKGAVPLVLLVAHRVW